MKRVLVLIVVLLSLGAASTVAADLPVVRQPSDPAYTADDRAALAAAWADINTLLRPIYSLPRLLQMRGFSWGDLDYVQFVAGTLETAGYPSLLASGPWDGDATRTWILAGVPLPQGGVGYIPVEAVPSALTSRTAIGQVAWQGGIAGTSFDTRYLRFTQAQALPANSPPTVGLALANPPAVVDVEATFTVPGMDYDGGILCYIWTISDGTTIVEPRAALRYTFRKTGDATVTVVVIDTRGAQTVLSEEVEVLAEKPDCGCGH